MIESRRISVLHLGKYYPPERGGMETHVEALCRRHSSELDVSVIVANTRPENVEEIRDGARILRLASVAKLAATPLCPGILMAIRHHPADIVHLHVPNPVATLAYLLSGHRGRLVVTYHSDVVRQKFLGRLFEPIMQTALRRAKRIIVTSPEYMESSPSLQPHLDRCRVVPHGIDPSEFTDPALESEASEIRRRYPGNIVLAVGRLTGYKGFEYLVAAANRFDGHVLIAGEGDLRHALERSIARAGLGNRVHLLGEVDDIRPYYQAADVFVLPSIERSEAFGIVQLEAMAVGIPVVNTKLKSGVPFVSVDGETGLTVEPRDASALGDAIGYLLGHPVERRTFGDAAKKRLAKLFHIDVMAADTRRVYDEAVNA